jgi:hypothetical protein
VCDRGGVSGVRSGVLTFGLCGSGLSIHVVMPRNIIARNGARKATICTDLLGTHS